MRLLTLSFDDGFLKSFTEIAEIHARHGLHACLNVMAEGHSMDLNSTRPSAQRWSTSGSRKELPTR